MELELTIDSYYPRNATNSTLFDNGQAYIFPYLAYDHSHIFFIAALVVLIVTGIPGNLLIIAAVSLNRDLRVPKNYFLVSLALSDLTISGIVNIAAIISLLNGGGQFWERHWWFCEVVATLCTIMCGGSVYNIATIAIHRYLAISRPFWYNSWFRPRVVVYSLIIPWSLAMLVDSIHFIPYFEVPHIYDEKSAVCLNNTKSFLVTLVINNGIVISMGITAFCYIMCYRILAKCRQHVPTPVTKLDKTDDDNDGGILRGMGWTLRGKGSRQSDVATNSSSVTSSKWLMLTQTSSVNESAMSNKRPEPTPARAMSTNLSFVNEDAVPLTGDDKTAPTVTEPERRNTRKSIAPKRSRDDRVLDESMRTLILMSFCFITMWMPYTVVTLTELFGFELHPFWHKCGVLLGHATSSINVFLYGFSNNNFRRAYWDVFRYIGRAFPSL